MTEQTGDKPLHLPITGQQSVVNDVMVPLLKRTGMSVTATDTKEGMTLTRVFSEPPEFDPDSFGTDDADNARLLWELRGVFERARAL